MTMNVTVETYIRRAVNQVAAFAMDPSNDTSWIGGITSVRRLDEGPLGQGSQVERVARFLGKTIRYVNEIVAFEPPDRLAMHAVDSPFPMDVTYTFARDADTGGTVARIEVRGEPKGFYSAVARPLLRRMVARNVGHDLKRLKQRLEQSPGSGGPA